MSFNFCLFQPQAIKKIALIIVGLVSAIPYAHGQTASPPEHADIAHAVEQFLQEKLNAISSTNSIELDPIKTSNIAACDKLQIMSANRFKLRPRVTVGVRCTAPQVWVVYVQANLNATGIYYISSQPIPPNQPITDNDITEQEGNLLALAADVITDKNNILGKTANFRIAAGQPFKSQTLQTAHTINKGDPVRIIARGNGFVVSNEGTAQESGSLGKSIQIKTASGQLISATVMGPGAVEIRL